MELNISLVSKRKDKWKDEDDIVFGGQYTDHMFVMDYNEEEGWHNPTIKPYGNISLDPAALVFHYGQELFEGMKAYKTKDGVVQLFRPIENFKRLNRSAKRIAVPKLDEKKALSYLVELLKIEKDWVPKKEGKSLYIRPFIIATQAEIGIKSSNQYKFIIILTPSGSYYTNDLSPIDIYVETKHVRATQGGTGDVKVGGNYAATLQAQENAEEKGYSQVLWLDSLERKYVEEAGSMNIFFVIDGVVVTPSLSGTILPGITRMSIIEILKDNGYKVEERKISIDELIEASKKGILDEAFGTGTAAVISPIKLFSYKEDIIKTKYEKAGEVAKLAYKTLTSLQTGKMEDTRDWILKI